jgi:hypothetical protein
LDRVPAALSSSDLCGVSPDDRQVAIESANSHRDWWSSLMMKEYGVGKKKAEKKQKTGRS